MENKANSFCTIVSFLMLGAIGPSGFVAGPNRESNESLSCVQGHAPDIHPPSLPATNLAIVMRSSPSGSSGVVRHHNADQFADHLATKDTVTPPNEDLAVVMRRSPPRSSGTTTQINLPTKLPPRTLLHQSPRIVSHQPPRKLSHQPTRTPSHQTPRPLSHQPSRKLLHQPLTTTFGSSTTTFSSSLALALHARARSFPPASVPPSGNPDCGQRNDEDAEEPPPRALRNTADPEPAP